LDQVIAIVASAGGVEALSAFVRHLPERLPAPLLVAQHLARNRESSLREILQRRTCLEGAVG
jgi:chemotaxis response regulator CheB